ncbi:MAG: winged helix-turn-helix domain-containing protein [Fervidobacterium sp.]
MFYNRSLWTKTFLKKAWLIETLSRGNFKITKSGIKLLKENPKYIDRKLLN